MKECSEMTSFEVADHLRVWRDTYKDPHNNFDARLLQRAADLIEELQEKANAHEDCPDALTIAYTMGVEKAREAFRRETKHMKESQNETD